METASCAVRDAALVSRLQMVVPRVRNEGARGLTLAMREVGLSPCYRYQISMEIIQKE